MLSDPSRCQVLLVTTPGRDPRQRDDRDGTAPGGEGRHQARRCRRQRAAPGIGPASGRSSRPSWRKLVEAAGTKLSSGGAGQPGRSRRAAPSQRQESQAAQVARLAVELPLAQLELPFCFSSELGPDELEL